MHLVVLYIVLFGIVYQDFKERQVYLLWYPILLLVLMYQFYTMTNVPYSLLVFNLSLVFVLMAIIFIYYRFKKHTITSFFETVFGLGDLLFLVFMALFFAPANFLIVFNSSLILCLLLALGIKSFKTSGVPLAGVQSLVVFFWVVGNELGLTPANFDDSWMLSL